jgi:hypothetical protein
MIGEPDAGKPHVRFDEGVQETCGIAARLRPTLRVPLAGRGAAPRVPYRALSARHQALAPRHSRGLIAVKDCRHGCSGAGGRCKAT